MKKVERSGQVMVWGKSIKGSIDYGYCPLCPYASHNHRTLNNHVRLHFRVSMACGMPNCWYVTHSADSMWKHAASHGIHTAEPITINPKKKQYGSVPVLSYFPTCLHRFLQLTMAITNIPTGPSLGFPEEVQKTKKFLEFDGGLPLVLCLSINQDTVDQICQL